MVLSTNSLPILFVVITFIVICPFYQRKYIPRREFIYDKTCCWPPEQISEIENDGVYSLNPCIKLTTDAKIKSVPKRYYMNELFYVSLSKEPITFEQLRKLPRKVFKTAKYPSIYQTYPQDVPIIDIVQNITEGQGVSYVSVFFTLVT